MKIEAYKILHNDTRPNGATAQRRLWGVSFVKPVTSKRKKFLGPDNEVLPDFEEENAERMSFGEPDMLYSERAGYYRAIIGIRGRTYHLGVSSLPRTAARLYDSALYYCWGLLTKPKPRFNFPGEIPRLFPVVQKLRDRLIAKLVRSGLDEATLSKTYQNTHE